MKVGIIGCGSIGSRHARNIVDLGHDVFLCDSDHHKAMPLAHTLGLAGYSVELTQAYAEAIDAVLICTPANTHRQVAQKLLDFGYRGPLFVEKPLAISVPDALWFVHTWPNRVTMVGYNLRFHHWARAMRAMFIKPICGRASLGTDMRTWPGQSYGDPILECSHEIDLVLWWGAKGIVTGVRRTDSRIDIQIGDWSVRLGFQEKEFREWSIGNERLAYQQHFDSAAALGDQMYRDEIEYFLECAASRIATETPFVDSVRVLGVIEQVKNFKERIA